MTPTRPALALAALLAATAPPALAEDALRVLNWSGYIDPAMLEGFTAETGIAVDYETYNDSEATEATLTAGGSGYDLVVVSSEYLMRLVEGGAVAPFDLDAIPGRAALDPGLMARLATLDPGGRFAVPYLWGTTAVGYDRVAVAQRMPDAPVDSWAMVFDPDVVSRFADCGVGFVDTPEEVTAAALAHLGRDPNSTDPADVEAALAAIEAVAPHVARFDADAQEALAQGDLCVALAWSGDVLEAADTQREGIDVAYSIPREGALIWFDVMVLPADAARPEAAHALVAHLMRPEVIALATAETWYPNPNAEAAALIDAELRSNPAVYPPGADMERLFAVRSRPPAQKAALARAWRRLKLAL